jgi:WhiB family redox-sensing transcriptional regulator
MKARHVPCVDCGTIRTITYTGAPAERCAACAFMYQAEQRRAHHPGPWIISGLCGQVAPELWFLERGADSRTVKGICGRCTVNTTCLDWAIDTDQLHGIWGGMTRTERTREAARRRAAP